MGRGVGACPRNIGIVMSISICNPRWQYNRWQYNTMTRTVTSSPRGGHTLTVRVHE